MPNMQISDLQTQVDAVLAPMIAALRLRIDAIEGDSVLLHWPFDAATVHGGGVICGQAIASVADTAMLAAICAKLGGFKPMTTVDLNVHFMRPLPPGDVCVRATVLRAGKQLVFGQVSLAPKDDVRTAALATMTYALL